MKKPICITALKTQKNPNTSSRVMGLWCAGIVQVVPVGVLCFMEQLRKEDWKERSTY